MQSRFSLKQAWSALILFAVITPVSIVLVWYGQQLYNDQLKSALIIERQANEGLRNQIEFEVNHLKSVLENKTDPLLFLLHKFDSPEAKKEINSLLAVLVDREKSIREIIVASPQGEILSAIEPGLGINGGRILTKEELDGVKGHWGFKQDVDSPEIVIPSMGRIYIGSPNKHEDFIGFDLAAPIGNPVEAILIARIDVNTLLVRESDKNNFYSEKTRNYLLDRRGSLISEIHNSKYKLGDLMTHLEITRSALIDEEWIIENSYIGVNDQSVYGTLTVIPSLNWSLVSEVIVSKITGPIWESLNKLVFITLLVVLVFIGLVYNLARKTLMPIQKACEAIDYVAKGDYGVVLNPSGIKEIDVLSMGFNNMAKEILDREIAIHDIAAGVSGKFGNVFFESITNNLCKLFEAKYAFIGLLDDKDPMQVNSLAVSINGIASENFSYHLRDTPCAEVVGKVACCYPEKVQALFPEDILLKEMEVEGYIGTPLFDTKKNPVGLIVVMDTKAIVKLSQVQPIVEIFAIRAGAEIERITVENNLRESELRFRQLAENIEAVFWLGSPDWQNIHYASPALEKKWGIKPESLYENPLLWLEAVHPDDKEQVIADIPKDPNDIKDIVDFKEYRIKSTDDKYIWIKARAYPIRDSSDNIIRVAGIAEDITARVSADETIRRTQKMDALGKLTGGIAHDYNNMLGIVLGYAGLLENALDDHPKLARYAQEILSAGKRGSKLTEKLLSFSRHKKSATERVNINSLLREQEHMLSKTLTARINLVYDLDIDLWTTSLDASELEDAVLNMCINAMHAMEGGGVLTIRSSNVHVSATEALILGLGQGDYVSLTVSDTGCGMNKETQEKLFEPFYSTKGEKGTGLGLSQVYGFVERSGGSITVKSELGQGSTLILYFPRTENKKDYVKTSKENTEENLDGSETILVVDDEPALIALAEEILMARGYRVLKANSGFQALKELNKESVDIIISDVIMPNMDGYQLAAEVRKLYPNVKIQLVSGFADKSKSELTDDRIYQDILYKPYNSIDLLKRVRSLLDKDRYIPQT